MKKSGSDPVSDGRPKRLPLVIVAVVVVVALVALAVYAVWRGGQTDDWRTDAETRTVTIERTSLVAGFAIPGTLGYGTATALGGGGGVVTKLPQAGQMVDAGQVVMEVEGAPVFILQGDLPLWQEIGPGSTGVDVAMLRAALARAGIEAGDPASQTYDDALSSAIGQLYVRAGYESQPLTREQKANRESARTSLEGAQRGLESARSALAAAQNRKPSQVDVLQADSGVHQAQAAYNKVLSGNCGDKENPRDCTQAEVVAAQDALNIAKATRAQLDQAPDTSAEQAAVSEAQRQVSDAQTAYDRTQGNTVSPQTVLIVPEPQIRIDNVTATLGMAAQNSVLTWTRTVLYGHVSLTDAQRRMLSTGTKAILELPDGSTVEGVVGELTDAKTDPNGQTTQPSARIDVTDQAALAKIGATSVKASFVQDTAEDTLVVPVTALMALAEGGYCVERPDGSLVGVEVGLVADTRAQIFSDQLSEGDEVVVP